MKKPRARGMGPASSPSPRDCCHNGASGQSSQFAGIRGSPCSGGGCQGVRPPDFQAEWFLGTQESSPGPVSCWGGGRSQQNASARAGKTCLALGAWASIKLLIQPSECQHIISLPGRDQMVPTHPSLHFYLSGFHLDG